jgi:hypothetical protein
MAEFARVRLVNDAKGGDDTARKHNDEEKTETTGLQP